jgi:hypothetical protein
MKKLIDKGESQKLHATPSKPKKKEKEASSGIAWHCFASLRHRSPHRWTRVYVAFGSAAWCLVGGMTSFAAGSLLSRRWHDFGPSG